MVFLIGDFTGMIGDPTGKNATRPPLSREDIARNAATYSDQVFKILDKSRTEVAFNSTWMDRLSAADMIKLAAPTRRAAGRLRFSKRYLGNSDRDHNSCIAGAWYDSSRSSVLELGGTDPNYLLI